MTIYVIGGVWQPVFTQDLPGSGCARHLVRPGKYSVVPATAAKRHCPGCPVAPPAAGDAVRPGNFQSTRYRRQAVPPGRTHAHLHLVASVGPVVLPCARRPTSGPPGKRARLRRDGFERGVSVPPGPPPWCAVTVNLSIPAGPARGLGNSFPGNDVLGRCAPGLRTAPVIPSSDRARATCPSRLPSSGAHRRSGLPRPGVPSRCSRLGSAWERHSPVASGVSPTALLRELRPCQPSRATLAWLSGWVFPSWVAALARDSTRAGVLRCRLSPRSARTLAVEWARVVGIVGHQARPRSWSFWPDPRIGLRLLRSRLGQAAVASFRVAAEASLHHRPLAVIGYGFGDQPSDCARARSGRLPI